MSHAYVWPNSSVVRDHVHYERVLDSSQGRVMGGGGGYVIHEEKSYAQTGTRNPGPIVDRTNTLTT